MKTLKCYQCGKEFGESETVCAQCGAPRNSNIPNYPRMGGKAFLVIWIFFVSLIVIFLVSMFSMGN